MRKYMNLAWVNVIIIALLLPILALLTATTTSAAGTYNYRCDPWAVEYMEAGKDQLYLDPAMIRTDARKPITRAEMAVLMVNTMTNVGTGFNHDHNFHGTNTFTDVPATDVHYDYIECAYAAGIIKGIGNNKFNPNATITRQDAAVMVARTLLAINPNRNELSASPFADDKYIADYAKESTRILKRYAIAEGVVDAFDTEKIFNPYGNCKIEEAVKMCLLTIENQ